MEGFSHFQLRKDDDYTEKMMEKSKQISGYLFRVSYYIFKLNTKT